MYTYMKTLDYTTKTVDQVLSDLETSAHGLSHTEAEKRISRYGANTIHQKRQLWFDILVRQLKSPFLYMLFGAAILSVCFGQVIDSVMIVLFIFINTGFGFYQEYKSEETLKLLTGIIKKTSHVMRDGKEETIPSAHIVPGDILVLNAGDIIAADIRMIEQANFTVDESVLTGESATVGKTPDSMKETVKETYKAVNIGFSGTVVATGRAMGVVIATGRNTELGTITDLSTETKRESNFEKNIARFSKFILYLILITLVVVFAMNIAIKGFTELPRLLIFSIALAVSVIPEALPVVITFSLSRGALKLSKQKVIIKRLSSIEDLGSIEVLCTDKTGTLTENSLSVSEIYPKTKSADVLLYGGLATTDAHVQNASIHSFDMAILKALTPTERHAMREYKRVSETPFDPVRKRSSYVLQRGKNFELITKGAPEEILKLTKTTPQTKALRDWVREEGRAGKRVVMIAKKDISSAEKDDEHNLTVVGCVSFVDPIKASTKDAIARAKYLGIGVKILTGDSAEVAGAVAHQVGLIDDPSYVITGEEFDKLSHSKQHDAVMNYNVFARVSPAQKYEIIHVLEKNNVVGFLGEGINDAPALKTANVGLVVSDATDVARESADIILLKKDLKVIVDGIHEGRVIFTNTSKYIKATLASNFGNFYTVAVASLFVTFLPLLPLQLLLINLLTDFPMIAVAADNVDAEEVTKPKQYDLKDTILIATILGVISSVFDFMFFILYYQQGPSTLQTNWFIGSVITELVFLFSIRTKKFVFDAKGPSPILLGLTATAFAVGIITPFTAFGHSIFSFITPTGTQIVLAVAIVGLYFTVTEAVKLLYYRHKPV